jgi:hypothetical protein
MIDHATKDRQAFIQTGSAKADTLDPLAEKVTALRLRLHREGRALAGEEILARKMGWQVFEWRPFDPKQTLRFLKTK